MRATRPAFGAGVLRGEGEAVGVALGAVLVLEGPARSSGCPEEWQRHYAAVRELGEKEGAAPRVTCTGWVSGSGCQDRRHTVWTGQRPTQATSACLPGRPRGLQTGERFWRVVYENGEGQHLLHQFGMG